MRAFKEKIRESLTFLSMNTLKSLYGDLSFGGDAQELLRSGKFSATLEAQEKMVKAAKPGNKSIMVSNI